MSALLLSMALSLAAPPESASTNGSVPKSGLHGWGLGLEIPVIGVMSGLGAKSRPGWGYTLGGAVAYELTPTILGRLHVVGGQTDGGRAPIRYIADVQTSSTPNSRRKLDAQWTTLEVGLGGAYLFRSVERAWAPYVGADAGMRYGSYAFHFDVPVKSLQVVDPAGVAKGCTDPTCPDSVNAVTSLGWVASVRSGVRLDLASWLMAQPELEVAYTRTSGDRVTNTVQNREVRGVVENLWLVRATFSVRVGL